MLILSVYNYQSTNRGYRLQHRQYGLYNVKIRSISFRPRLCNSSVKARFWKYEFLNHKESTGVIIETRLQRGAENVCVIHNLKVVEALFSPFRYCNRNFVRPCSFNTYYQFLLHDACACQVEVRDPNCFNHFLLNRQAFACCSQCCMRHTCSPIRVNTAQHLSVIVISLPGCSTPWPYPISDDSLE